MTTDRERILEVLRETAERLPDYPIGWLVEQAAAQGGSVPAHVADRDLLYGLLDMKKGKP